MEEKCSCEPTEILIFPCSESALKEILVEKAGKKNYIPNSVKEEYKKALFREFKKFLGEKVEEEEDFWK